MNHTNSKTRRIMEKLKTTPMNAREIAEFSGYDSVRKASTLIAGLRARGMPIGMRQRMTGENEFYFCDEYATPKRIYERIYEKMTIDKPHEWWTIDELAGVFSTKRAYIINHLARVRKNISPIDKMIVCENGKYVHYFRISNDCNGD